MQPHTPPFPQPGLYGPPGPLGFVGPLFPHLQPSPQQPPAQGLRPQYANSSNHGGGGAHRANRRRGRNNQNTTHVPNGYTYPFPGPPPMLMPPRPGFFAFTNPPATGPALLNPSHGTVPPPLHSHSPLRPAPPRSTSIPFHPLPPRPPNPPASMPRTPVVSRPVGMASNMTTPVVNNASPAQRGGTNAAPTSGRNVLPIPLPQSTATRPASVGLSPLSTNESKAKGKRKQDTESKYEPSGQLANSSVLQHLTAVTKGNRVSLEAILHSTRMEHVQKQAHIEEKRSKVLSQLRAALHAARMADSDVERMNRSTQDFLSAATLPTNVSRRDEYLRDAVGSMKQASEHSSRAKALYDKVNAHREALEGLSVEVNGALRRFYETMHSGLIMVLGEMAKKEHLEEQEKLMAEEKVVAKEKAMEKTVATEGEKQVAAKVEKKGVVKELVKTASETGYEASDEAGTEGMGNSNESMASSVLTASSNVTKQDGTKQDGRKKGSAKRNGKGHWAKKGAAKKGGVKQETAKLDGAKQDGVKDEPRKDGAKHDGAKQGGAKKDGVKQDGVKPGVVNKDESNKDEATTKGG